LRECDGYGLDTCPLQDGTYGHLVSVDFTKVQTIQCGAGGWRANLSISNVIGCNWAINGVLGEVGFRCGLHLARDGSTPSRAVVLINCSFDAAGIDTALWIEEGLNICTINTRAGAMTGYSGIGTNFPANLIRVGCDDGVSASPREIELILDSLDGGLTPGIKAHVFEKGANVTVRNPRYTNIHATAAKRDYNSDYDKIANLQVNEEGCELFPRRKYKALGIWSPADTGALDLDQGGYHSVSFDTDITLTVSGYRYQGQQLVLRLNNAAGADKTVTLPADFKTSGAISVTASKTAVLVFAFDSVDWIEQSRIAGVG
jgi:hypothetical protein